MLRALFSHPVLRLGVVLFLLRLSALLLRFLLLSGIGELKWLPAFGVGALYVFGETFLVTGLVLALWQVAGRFRAVVALLMALGLPVFLVASMTDLIVFHIIGDHLTPSLFRQFVGPRLFVDTDFWQPVLANWMPISAALATIFAYFAWAVWSARRLQSRSAQHDLAWPAVALPVAVAVLALAAAFRLSPRSADQPVLVAFLQELAGLDGVRLKGSERAAVQRLREFLGLPPGRRWLSDKYPLVHVAEDRRNLTPPPETLPDIILVAIESLRAPALGFIVGAGSESATPNLDRLASESVVFPEFIANGFPTGPGMISILDSSWPHYRKRVVSDFLDLHLDMITHRLESLGYRTLYIEHSPDSEGTYHWLKRLFHDRIELHGRKSERRLFADATQALEDWDAKATGRPMFMVIKTDTPHLPYITPDDGNPPSWATELSLPANYRHNIHYVDQHLGSFVAHLRARPRIGKTILMVTGDHSNYVDQQKTTNLPVDDVVWTGLLIHAPEAMIGPPRRIMAAASEVDIVPTLLALIGDRRASAALGRNLLGPPRNGLKALAVRGGGIRLDRDGRSLYVERSRPWDSWVEPAFAPLALKHGVPAPFSRSEHSDLYEVVFTWSYLMEHDRIWRPALLEEP